MALVERFQVFLKMQEPFLPKKTDMEPRINRTCLPAAAWPAQDTGFVFHPITVGGKVVGAIGVIGPQRMDYKKVVASLDYFAAGLTEQIALPEVTAEAQGTYEERKTTHGGE